MNIAIFKQILSILSISFFSHAVLAQDSLSHYSLAKLDSISQDYKDKEAYELLLPYAKAALIKAEEEYGKQDTFYARKLYDLGYAFDYGQGEFSRGLFYYQQAERLQKKLIPNSSAYAQTLFVIGDIYYSSLNQYQEAVEFYLQAISIYKKMGQTQELNYAFCLSSLANCYSDLGLYKQAEPIHFQYLEILKNKLGDQSSYYAGGLNNLALMYENLGRYEEAEPLYLQAKLIYKNSLGEEHDYHATALLNLSGLYESMGYYEGAEQLILQAIAIYKKTVGKENLSYAMSLNNLAVLYFNTGRYQKAEQPYLESMELHKKLLGEQHSSQASTLHNLALLYHRMDRKEDAESLYRKAILMREQLFGKQHPQYASSLERLALLYDELGRYGEAEKLYLQASQIYREVFGSKQIKYISSLNLLSGLYIKTNQFSKSTYYNLQALRLNSSLDLSPQISKAWADSLLEADCIDRPQIISSLNNNYSLLENSKPPHYLEAQIILSELAMQLLKNHRDSYTETEDKLRLLSDNADWTWRGLRALAETGQMEKAFELAEKNKSILLMDAAQTERAYSFGDLPDSLIQQEQSLQKEYAWLKASLLVNRQKKEKDSLRTELTERTAALKAFKARIEQNYPKFSQLKYADNSVNAQQIQSLLAAQTAILEYVVGKTAVYIFYIDGEQLRLLEVPVDQKELDKKIRQLRKNLSNYELLARSPDEAYDNYTSVAYWFYQNLVAPALSTASDIKHLIIITDGNLGHLPFGAFLTKEVGGEHNNYAKLPYLLNDYSISYNYSAALWKDNETYKSQQINSQLLAMVADYDSSYFSQNKHNRLPFYQRLRKNLLPLPAAQQEVKMLSEQFQGYFAFGKEASEKVFKQKSDQYGIIHLAMHGLLHQKTPILSSLAFTEDGDSVENNFLQAHEVSKLELNAELVVLSACETGYGKFEKGNGIASLAQAFMYAGVPSLVVSLWEVNDGSTSFIMQNFYQNLGKGMDKAAALQQAKLYYIANSKGIMGHPAFWSAFIQIGNHRPVEMAAKSGGAWLWGLASGILLLLGIGVRRISQKSTKV